MDDVDGTANVDGLGSVFRGAPLNAILSNPNGDVGETPPVSGGVCNDADELGVMGVWSGVEPTMSAPIRAYIASCDEELRLALVAAASLLPGTLTRFIALAPFPTVSVGVEVVFKVVLVVALLLRGIVGDRALLVSPLRSK